MSENKPESSLYRNRGWLLALFFSSLLIMGVTLPAFVDGYLNAIVMVAFSTVCHQLPERSFHINGSQLAVCHRCYGLYAGIWLAVIMYLVLYRWDRQLYRYTPFLIAASLIVPGVDWLGGLFGIWENTTITRLFTGAVFGFIAGYLLARAFTRTFSRQGESEAETVIT